MILFKKANDLIKYLDNQRNLGKKLGFVPTMGALHEGHLSLIRLSKAATDLTICSIFVNPTQFNDPADFEKYPITTDKDIALLLTAGCDLLFLPAVGEMYPDGIMRKSVYDLGDMETLLEGKFRPGHFQGVCQVVHQLLAQVNPHDLFLGQKDYQQCMVIDRLMQQTGFKETVTLHICPTLRETDGLEQEGFQTDYLVVADAGTLQPVSNWDGSQKLVALVAAFLGGVRLIDNLPLN